MHIYIYIIYMYMYCRASHTGDATRVMYSSVSAGVVHVLGACAGAGFSSCTGPFASGFAIPFAALFGLIWPKT